ncbi:hypothetical protein PVT68_09295 [Microbulbifer bruguierae]|uniref:DUF11 domain-containing protein n=1 Tax=Microbulbifer bruguierae TaxID=3029061 RepID=A0ABY8NHW1_9GAMM|nr:hypothetical protein [Microbulbifer bruguierae]WGL18501.1 hypothetical protein PVT68_09295 [Microbulbifer bruguierae]
MFKKNTMHIGAAFILLAVGMVPQVFAAGTAAGTPIKNTASVSYKVDGLDQEAVPSNTAEFIVDRIVDMTLEEDGASYVSTVPGAKNQVTTYTLTNLSNAEIQFGLEADNSAGIVFNDDKDGTNIRIFLDDGTTPGSFDAGDTEVTSVNLLGDTDFSASASPQATIYVVIDVPLDNGGDLILNGERIEVELTATAKEAGGASLSLGPDADGAYTVLGDDPLLAAGAGQYDGIVIAYGAYEVGTASLTVEKSSEVISDPINGTTSPFAIPGAVIEYCIDVSNDGSAEAQSVILTDALPSEVTFATGADQVFETGTGVCSSRTTTHAATEATFDGTDTVTATFTDPVAATESVWVSFRVKLN